MTPSCLSLRRRSSGRWRRLTEIREQEEDTELGKKIKIWKKKEEIGREYWGWIEIQLRENERKKVERWKEQCVTEGRLRCMVEARVLRRWIFLWTIWMSASSLDQTHVK